MADDDKPSRIAALLRGLPNPVDSARAMVNTMGEEGNSFLQAMMIPGKVNNGEIQMRDAEGNLSPEGVDAGVDLAYNIGGIGSAVPRPAGSIGIFGGQRGLGNDIAAKMQAREMEKRGVSPSRIWQETNQGRNPADQDWRYEITTGDAKVGNGLTDIARGKMVPLSRFYDSPSLYENYPHLAEVPVHNQVNPGAMGTNLGDSIGLAIDNQGRGYNGLITSKAMLKPVMEHEIQHGIQDFEGFARGGSHQEFIPPPEKLQKLEGLKRELDDALTLKQVARDRGHNDVQKVFDEMQDKTRLSPRSVEWAPLDEDILLKRRADIEQALTDPESAAFKMYERLAGEAEARLAAARGHLNPAEARQKYPFTVRDDMLGFDIPPEEQIVKYRARGGNLADILRGQ